MKALSEPRETRRRLLQRSLAIIVSSSFLATPAAVASSGQAVHAISRAQAVATIDPRLLRDAAAEVEDPGVETPPMPLPNDLPVPAAFAWRADTPEPQEIAPQFMPAPEFATISRTFPALSDDNTLTPPDTSGAAGPNHLVVALNTQFRVQSRTGNVLLTTSLRSFFETVRNSGRVFDPHVAYDSRANRWILCAVNDQRVSSLAPPTKSGVLLAVSRTADPLGLWDLYRYAAPDDTAWFDFPQLGFNDATIFLSMNVYATADNKFVRATIYQISRADPANQATAIDYTNNGGGLSPVTSYDAGAAAFVVQRWNGNSSGNGYLRLYSLDPSGITPIAFVSTPFPWTASGPVDEDFAPQAGTAQKIAAGDDRILGPVLRNGSIWAVHTVFLPTGTPTRAATQWWQIAPSGALLQRGILEDPANTFSYTFPSIAVNLRNDIVIAGTRFSAGTFPSAFYLYRPAVTPVTSETQPVIFRSGEAPYVKTISTATARNRWGDYSAACVDPLNGVDFWTIQEYSEIPSAGVDRWGTWWVQLTIADGPPRRRSVLH